MKQINTGLLVMYIIMIGNLGFAIYNYYSPIYDASMTSIIAWFYTCCAATGCVIKEYNDNK